VGIDDLPDDCQSESCSVRLGGGERLKNFHFRRNSCPCICDLQLNNASRILPAHGQNTALRHCLNGVFAEID
jgi:hypothetical protein